MLVYLHEITIVQQINAHTPTCFACSRTHVPACLQCLRASRHAVHAYVLMCQCDLQVHVLTFQHPLIPLPQTDRVTR